MELQRSSVPGMMNRLGDEDGRSSTYPDLQEIKEGGGDVWYVLDHRLRKPAPRRSSRRLALRLPKNQTAHP
jgi:hypothetical protein